MKNLTKHKNNGVCRMVAMSIAAALMVLNFGSCNTDDNEETKDPTVYAGGMINDAVNIEIATLWTNDSAQTLSGGIKGSCVMSVYVLGNDVYAGGYVANASKKNVATLWKNGTPQPLSDGLSVASIYSIYVTK